MNDDGPARADTADYEIRVQGLLDHHWSAWFDDCAISGRSDGTTTITTAAIDQAALHGLLRLVRDAGLRLISITRLGPTAD